MSGKKPITPRGYERLQNELMRLWHEDRPRIVQEVSDAAALGDRSENAEYIYGKKKLREIDRRIGYLNQLIERLEIVDPKANVSPRVKFGATVVVEDEGGQQRTYQLVGEDEVDAKAGQISLVSPMGRALFNRSVGEDVTVKRPAGDLDLVIVSLRYD